MKVGHQIALQAASAIRDGDFQKAEQLAKLTLMEDLSSLLSGRHISQADADFLFKHCSDADPPHNSMNLERQFQPTPKGARTRNGNPVSLPLDWNGCAHEFFAWVGRKSEGGTFTLDQPFIPAYGFVGIAALARSRQKKRSQVQYRYGCQSTNFAQAIGFREFLQGDAAFTPKDSSKTIPLAGVYKREDTISIPKRIAQQIAPNPKDIEIRKTVEYSLVELLRNVVQHSCDKLGGIVAAQRIHPKHGPQGNEAIQIAVSDCGIGIAKSLEKHHPDTRESPLAALQKAIRPHISGTFEEGKIEFEENAGLGLFFLTSIAKKLGGRFLIATRGAAISVEGDKATGHTGKVTKLLDSEFPGTLVCLKIPVIFPDRIKSSDTLLQEIRTEKDNTYLTGDNFWISFDEEIYHESGIKPTRILISIGATDFKTASHLTSSRLIPAIEEGIPLILDFNNVTLITDSFAHELLAKLLRVAYSTNVPVWAVNTEAAVMNTILFVQRYALADLSPKRKLKRGRKGYKSTYLKPPPMK
jgi:hypothetical protein